MRYVPAIFLLLRLAPAQGQVNIAVDTTLHFQTMEGWEVMGWVGQWGSPWLQTHFGEFQPGLISGAANAGVTRARIEVYSGSENPVDHFQQFLDGVYDEDGFIAVAYDIVNDNADASATDTSHFHFTQLDHDMDHMLVPLKNAVESQGRAFATNLCYVDFGTSAFEHWTDPNEYAEFLLATFQHLQRKYGFVPNTVEALLEPENAAWPGPASLAAAIHAAGELLAAHGFRPEFIAPSCMDTFNAYVWGEAILDDPLAAAHVKELSYHKYSGAIDANLDLVRGAAQGHGVRSSMLEFWDNTNDQHALYRDLVHGGTSVWQNHIVGDDYVGATSPALFRVQHNDPLPATVIENDLTRYFRQYYLHIGQGARRTGAVVASPHEATAYIGTRGELIVVVNAASAGTFQLQVPSAGVYHRWRSTASLNHASLADQTVGAGGNVTITMPAAGVFTIVQEPPPAVQLDVRLALQGPLQANGTMATGLNAAGLLPGSSPYPALGFPSVSSIDRAATPTMLTASGDRTVVDWVQVELRDKFAPSTIVATRSGLLLRNGRVVDMDGSTLRLRGADDQYFIAVRHRNHLGVMTASAIPLSSATATTVDLTLPGTLCYGTDARASVYGMRALWCGDVAHDGSVKYTGTANDRDPVLVAIGGTVPTLTIAGYRSEDVGMDGTVKYTGANNDRDPILVNIGGTVPTAVRYAQLP